MKKRTTEIRSWEQVRVHRRDSLGQLSSLVSNALVNVRPGPEMIQTNRFTVLRCPVAIRFTSRFGATNLTTRTTSGGKTKLPLPELLRPLCGDQVTVHANARLKNGRQISSDLTMDAHSICQILLQKYGADAFINLPATQRRGKWIWSLKNYPL